MFSFIFHDIAPNGAPVAAVRNYLWSLCVSMGASQQGACWHTLLTAL
jgi:hypothetical protein